MVALSQIRAGSESAVGGKVGRHSMNRLSLFAALRMSESRFSSRGDQGEEKGQTCVGKTETREWQSFQGRGEYDVYISEEK